MNARKGIKQRGKGGLILLVLMGLLFIASLALVNGVIPEISKSNITDNGEEKILVDKPGTSADKSIQLKTIEFKNCSKIIAIDFLVDNSGSMGGSKLTNLKNGLKTFASSLPDSAVIGLQSFNGPQAPREIIPVSLYKNVKQKFSQWIDQMNADGWTYTRTAFNFSNSKIIQAIPQYPNHKFNLIFISDGVPETASCPRVRQPGCETGEDPTTSPNIADQIKSNGVRIFSIAYLDNNDIRWNNQLQTLMKNVASSSSDYYIAPQSNQISDILKQITTKLCQ